ncbi:LOW QUALITY PROTEIN: olfactory receptor 5B12-like [Gastrophryne carolinensis]
MENQTMLTVFFLSGLSDLPSLQLPLFLFFLLIYLLTLTWNLLIIFLIVTDSHLHTPMYFFLGNLASLDLCSSSVILPHMLFDLHTQIKIMTRNVCIAQIFFIHLFIVSEVFLLAVMSWDRYVAICRPLHYMQIMCWRVCVYCVCGSWCLSLFNSLLYTLPVLKLTFCGSNILESFFCDLPQLFTISCSDIFINVLLAMFSVAIFVGEFDLYLYILKTVLKMQIKGKRSKVLSVCSSHLTVVFIFYFSGFSNYSHLGYNVNLMSDKVTSVLYAVVTPLLNPLIYSLRNQEIRKAIRDGLKKLNSDEMLN